MPARSIHFGSAAFAQATVRAAWFLEKTYVKACETLGVNELVWFDISPPGVPPAFASVLDGLLIVTLRTNTSNGRQNAETIRRKNYNENDPWLQQFHRNTMRRPGICGASESPADPINEYDDD